MHSIEIGQDFLDTIWYVAAGGGGAVVRNETVRVDIYYEVLCPDSRSDQETYYGLEGNSETDAHVWSEFFILSV